MRLVALAFVLAVLALRPARAQAQASDPAGAIVDHSDRVARATVLLLMNGTVRERGVVLADDGRIVTALSPLGGETNVTVRYPNGRTAGGVVIGRDAVWGLALVQPRSGSWTAGLPLGSAARSNVPVRWTLGGEPQSQAGTLGRRHTFVGPGNELLRDAWAMDPPASDNAVGSGVANQNGELVAVVVPPDPTVTSGAAQGPFGAPVPVIRDLVASTPNAMRPWLGLVARNPRREDTQALALNGLRITEVTPHGPADAAGLRAGSPGDVIVGTPERPIRTTDDLASVLEPLHAGDTVTLRIVRAGVVFDLPIHLAPPPPIGP